MAKTKGLNEVMKNLRKELKKIENKTVEGALEAIAVVHRDTENTPPLTPVDFGNLRSSFFVISALTSDFSLDFKGPNAEKIQGRASTTVQKYLVKTTDIEKGFIIYFGYSAYYAAHVHENVFVKFKRPGSGPFFLESSIKRNYNKFIQIMAETAAIE